MWFVQKVLCVCVCVKKIASHTHTYNKHGKVLSWLHDHLPFMHASAWYVFLHLFWSYIISNIFLFCCTLWTCSVLPTYDVYVCFHKIHFAVLVAAVSEFWLSNSSDWLSDAFYVEHFTKQMISGFRRSFFFCCFFTQMILTRAWTRYIWSCLGPLNHTS